MRRQMTEDGRQMTDEMPQLFVILNSVICD
jgi:hypothetical protein